MQTRDPFTGKFVPLNKIRENKINIIIRCSWSLCRELLSLSEGRGYAETKSANRQARG